MDAAVVADDVSIEYRGSAVTRPVRAVDGVTFTLEHGEILAIVGESGSGKSTIAAAIAGRLGDRRADESTARRRIVGGRLEVLDQQVRNLPARSRRRTRLTGRIGYLAQDAGDRLPPDLTAGETIAAPIYARDRRFDRREAGLMVARLVDAVHLPLGVIEAGTWELSSGQRQRVALARALILEPELLVADEPARGVDVLVRQSVLEALTGLQRNRRFSAIVVSSDLREARALADAVAVMRSGRIIGIGAFDDVLDSPTDPYLKTLAATLGRPVRRPAPTSRRVASAVGAGAMASAPGKPDAVDDTQEDMP
ncbi:ATP-binding cassette domain-containing protein [Curtobacterium ammoniigenes]|uniref:ATP-binding cassette domain-containing protein n=1 Tax=Curtobacterium ammoniigenes TaxID=395387 RepID=UPI000830AB44|nr:ATP-binding cassette domain-containing protein [Curtobacterium ammoniigenes]